MRGEDSELSTYNGVFNWFFFFQAEDGIRDDLVTGVQTCALPISEGFVRARIERLGDLGRLWDGTDHAWIQPAIGGVALFGARSEERRVGKEGRSRGSPYH